MCDDGRLSGTRPPLLLPLFPPLVLFLLLLVLHGSKGGEKKLRQWVIRPTLYDVVTSCEKYYILFFSFPPPGIIFLKRDYVTADCSDTDLMFIPIVSRLSRRRRLQRVALRLSCIVLYLTSPQPESVCVCTSALCVSALHQRLKEMRQRSLQLTSVRFFDSSLSVC